MGRPPVELDHLLIGVVGGIQPDKLASMLAGDSDGLHARILFSWPGEPPHRSLSDTAPEAAPFILNALRRLILLPAGSTALLEPISLPLTVQARAAFEQFRRQHYDGKHVLEGRERETWAKAPSQVLRLSGVLAHLDSAGGLRQQFRHRSGASRDRGTLHRRRCRSVEHLSVAARLRLYSPDRPQR
jgi:hypothetical protein